MSLPSFYDPSRVGLLYPPDIQAAVDAGIALSLPPARDDDPSVALARCPERIERLRILEDGMSSVVVPSIDFDGLANEAYQRHRDNGLPFTNTAEAIG